MSHQVPSAAMHPERLGFRGSAFVFEQFLKDSLPATFIMKKQPLKLPGSQCFCPLTDGRWFLDKERGKSRMREVIKTIFFLVGVFGVCFEASFLVFFRRFSDCSKAFLTGFFFLQNFALICKHRQTSGLWPLRFYTARALFFLLCTSLFLVLEGRSVTIVRLRL